MNAKRKTRGVVPDEVASVAEALKGEAQAAGAVGARVTLAQRRLRDSAIIAALQAGQKVADVAETFELTARQVRRILKDHHAVPTALDARPMEIVEEAIRMYRRAIADFEAMADYYRDSHPNVTLGAKRSAIDTRERLQMLLEITGKLPGNLELFRQEAEIVRAGQRMFELMREVSEGRLSGAEAQDELRRVFGLQLEAPRDAIDGFAHELGEGEDGSLSG